MPKTPRNTRGSEWNKWDLHVHTPASILNNEFGDDWDGYVKNLFQKALEKEIVAIGITDYFLVEGYKKLREHYLSNEKKLKELFTQTEIEQISQILVIPNIEFRIDKLVIGHGGNDLKWNRKVNCHLLLSDDIPISAIEALLSDIKFEGLSTGKSAQKKSLTRANLIALGEELQKSQSEFQRHDPLFVGMMCAAVNIDQVNDALENDRVNFKGKYFFCLPADEDLSVVDWASQGHLERKNLLRKCDLVFSGNPNTVNFCLGKKHATELSFLEEFEHLKPCIWGSDAHSDEKLFEPDLKRYTWIKAAPTFEGLRQVLFEPHDRVRIQENIPGEKVPYRVIDRVRFVDGEDRKMFLPDWIRFNENLNVIIGGKSSGKSLLLHHIAQAVDPEQVRDRYGEEAVNYTELTDEIDFEVVWKSEDIDRLSEDQKNGQITFIPQLYVNRLAEKGGKRHLKELIQSILSQNDEFKNYFENSEEQRLAIKEEIRSEIFSILSLRSRYKATNDEIKILGTKQQIEAEINRLAAEIQALQTASGFTDDELAEYQLTERLVSEKKQDLTQKNNLRAALATFITKVSGRRSSVPNIIETEYRSLGQLPPGNLIEVLKNDLKSKLDKAFENFAVDASTQLNDLDSGLARDHEEIEVLDKKLEPFHTKTNNQELLKRRNIELQTQKTRKAELEQKLTELHSIKEQGKAAKAKLLAAYSDLYTLYKDRAAVLARPEYMKIGEELLLHSTLEFDQERFFESFTELFDLRARMRTVFTDRFDEQDQFIFAPEQHLGNIQDIYEKLPKIEDEDGLMVKTSTTRQDLFERLFDDYFTIEYSIEHKGDNILRMSPGKRGVVLLQLILHISSADHPILIDQPEDNLDNRTIYNELKGFIREKKEKRQIIIVTHNANLAVSTDAENVIVANQSGQQLGREKHEYQFEYVTGPLENTFRDAESTGILYQLGIREHVCDILEGGEEAFRQREQKYGFAH